MEKVAKTSVEYSLKGKEQKTRRLKCHCVLIHFVPEGMTQSEERKQEYSESSKTSLL